MLRLSTTVYGTEVVEVYRGRNIIRSSCGLYGFAFMRRAGTKCPCPHYSIESVRQAIDLLEERMARIAVVMEEQYNE